MSVHDRRNQAMDEEYILFVEKTHKLETSPFWRWLASKRKQSDMEKILDGGWLAHDGLGVEAMDSFCLTLRLLIQKGDGFCIREIGEKSKSWPDKYKQEARGIAEARQKLRKRLEEPSMLQIFPDKETTRETLFDVIFYGGLVHSNPRKRTKYKELVSSGMLSYLVFQMFSGTFFDYRNCIQTVAYHLVRYITGEEEKHQS